MNNLKMKKMAVCVLAALGLSACSSYNPVGDSDLRKPIGQAPPSGSAVKVTYFGNTTLLVQDGNTSLLVDGFLSRPSFGQTFFGKIGPDDAEINRTGIGRVDAILVGHSHYDHALDATALADKFETKVIGSRSFAQIYRGSHKAGRNSTLITVPMAGRTFHFGAFTVRFALSSHVSSHYSFQRRIEGPITERVQMPARSSEFKCGDVFALYISHPQGNMVVTTTAGAKAGQLSGREADVVFLGTGFLSKETPGQQNFYWQETVEATKPDVIVPVHWDNFFRKLSEPGGLKAAAVIDSPQRAMDLVKRKAGQRRVRVLDERESLWISHHKVYCPRPPG